MLSSARSVFGKAPEVVRRALFYAAATPEGGRARLGGRAPGHGAGVLEHDARGERTVKAAGWVPYRMHRVSRWVIDSLLIDGLLTFHAFKVPEN